MSRLPADPAALPPADPPAPPILRRPAERPAAPAKSAVPAAAEQQAVAAQIEEVYKLSQPKTAGGQGEVGPRANDLARKATQNMAERFVLRRKAMELAADGGELGLAFAVIETIGSEFQIDVLVVKETVLTKFAEKASEPDRAKAAVQQALELVDEALRENAMSWPNKAATAAVRAAQGAGTPPELRKQAVERRTKVQKLFEQWQQVEQAQAALAADPADAEANLAVGRWKCLVEGDWTAGVALLAKGSDGTLKAAAAQEQTGGADTRDTAQARRRLVGRRAGVCGRGESGVAAARGTLVSADGQPGGLAAGTGQGHEAARRDCRVPREPLAARKAAGEGRRQEARRADDPHAARRDETVRPGGVAMESRGRSAQQRGGHDARRRELPDHDEGPEGELVRVRAENEGPLRRRSTWSWTVAATATPAACDCCITRAGSRTNCRRPRGR